MTDRYYPVTREVPEVKPEPKPRCRCVRFIQVNGKDVCAGFWRAQVNASVCRCPCHGVRR